MKPILSILLILPGLAVGGCAGQRVNSEPADAVVPVSVAAAPSTDTAATARNGGVSEATFATAQHMAHEGMDAAEHAEMMADHHASSMDADHAEHMSGVPATAGQGYTVADVHFMQMMIPHHEQALRMVALAPDRGVSPDLHPILVRIDISQRDEIELMENWLRARGQVVPGADEKAAMKMAGLLTPEEFARLEASRGAEFDRLFLEFMIGHHAGALTMVDELFATPGAAQDPDIFRFATDVGADQIDEIGVMERLLERLESPN